MSLYPDVQDNSSQYSNSDFLEELSRKIDPTNNELMEIFPLLQNQPENPDLLQKAILGIISSRSSGLLNRLSAYLKSHVELLEAITHNTELASLFLVGENGQQMFTSIHKSILNEQAARTRLFIASNHLEKAKVSTNLADYKLFISNVVDLGTKMVALENIVDQSIKANDINTLKNSYQEIASLFGGCMIFNDILIQNKSRNSSESSDISNDLPMATENKGELNSWIKDQIKTRDMAIQNNHLLQDENRRLQEAYEDLLVQFENKKKENKSLKRQINENIASIQDQKDDLMQKIQFLQGKMKEYNAVNTDAEELKTENMRLQQKINQMNNQIDLELSAIKSENDSLHKRVSELQKQLNKKDEELASIQGKLNYMNEGNLESQDMQKKQQNELADLHRLYQNASESLFAANETIRVLRTENKNLREQISDQKKENDDLKTLLSRAQTRAKEQLEENDVLLKQLKKKSLTCDDEAHDMKAEISCLKKKLAEAYRFIAKLQRQIQDFRRQQARQRPCHAIHHIRSHRHNEYNDYDSYEPIDDYSYESIQQPSVSEDIQITPGLQDLDDQIRKLEKNVTKSKQVLQKKKRH